MPRNRSSADYSRFGAKIAEDFLLNETPMTQALQKVAVDEDLNPHQIARVAEVANQRTFQEKFASRGKGDVQFAPASSEDVIKDLNMPTKIAWDMSDYHELPDREKTASLDNVIQGNFGSDLTPLLPELEVKAGMEKVAYIPENLGDITTLQEFESKAEADLRNPRWTYDGITNFCEKLAATKRVFELERVEIAKLAQEERDNFLQICRRMMKAGHRIEDLMKVAFQTRPDQKESLKTLFGHIISELDKTAAFGKFISGHSVDPKTISKRLDEVIPPHGCEVINGAHPVTLSINILADLSKQWAQANEGESIAERSLDKAQKVRSAFTSSKKRYDYQGGIRRAHPIRPSEDEGRTAKVPKGRDYVSGVIQGLS